MRTINWGIIGTGNIARSFATDFKYTSGGKIVAAASRSLEKAREFCGDFQIETAYGSYEELYSDKNVDVVYVATPHHLHYINSKDAMMAGKAVLCEKPISISPAELESLWKIAEQSGQYLMEAMWTYFLPPITKAKEWTREGKIGTIKNIKADFAFKAEYDPMDRLFNPEFAGGALLDIGIYPIAFVWYIVDQFPKNITAISNMTETGVDMEETMIFEYEDQMIANLTASFAYDPPNNAIIAGTDGYILIPDFFMAKECFLYKGGKLVEHFKDDRQAVGYNYEIEAVNRDLAQGLKESEIMPLETSLRLQELMEAVKQKFDQ